MYTILHNQFVTIITLYVLTKTATTYIVKIYQEKKKCTKILQLQENLTLSQAL